MDTCRSFALAGVLWFALIAAVSVPTAASAAQAPAAAGLRAQVAALQSENRGLKAQIASANRNLGGRGTLAHRVRILGRRLGGDGSAIQRALDAQRLVGGTGDLAKRATSLGADLGGSGSARKRARAIEAILDGSGTLAQRAQSVAQDAANSTDSSAVSALTTQNQALTAQNQALTKDGEALGARVKALATNSDALQREVTAAKTTIGGTGELSDRLGALVTLAGGSDSLTDALTAVDQTLGGGGNLTTGSDDYVAAAGATAATIVNAQSRIGGSGTLTTRLDAVDAALGSSGTVVERLTSLSDSILTAPTGVLETDLTSARELIGTPAATLQADLDVIGQALDGTDPTAGAPIGDTLAGQVSSVQAGASDLGSAVSTVRTALGGVDVSISGKVSSLNTRLGGTGSAAGRTSAIHNALVTTPGETLSEDLAAVRNTLVSSPGTTLQGDVSSLALLLNGTSNGSTLQARIGYPTLGGNQSDLTTVIGTNGSNLAAQVGDPGGSFANVSAMIGTSDAASLAEGLGNGGVGTSSINALLGGSAATSPYRNIVGSSGILSSIDGTTTDSGTIAAKLNAQTATINADATQLNTSIGNVAARIGHSGTLAARIGSPTVNGTTSSLSAAIGGSGTTLAAQVGDPVTADSGLSQLIGATGATNDGAVFSGEGFNAFRNSPSLADQANAFLTLMDPVQWANPNATHLTFTVTTPPTTLGGFVGQASVVSE